MVTASRPLPWVASILYVAVLIAGVYYDAAGLSSEGNSSTAGFVGVLAFLLALEQVERLRFGLRTPRNLAIGVLALRVLLFEVVSSLDSSGFSRALYLLIPFTAYFSLGRRVSYAFAVFYLGAAVTKLSFLPGWYYNPERVSDLLMFFIGMVFAVSMAAVAAEAEASRMKAEANAEQLAELAAVTERNRLARDIHDSLGHHLTAIAVQLEKATAFRDRDATASEQALADARRSARYALEDVRQSVGALRNSDGAFSLSTAIGALVEGDNGFTIDLDITGDERTFGRPALMALYRAAQEGLTNARKHAGADRVALRIALGETCAHLLVADNGRGFTVGGAASTGAGYGLRGMRERLELVGGSLQVEAAPWQGTRLTATVPRRQDANS